MASNEATRGCDFASALRTHSQVRFQNGTIIRRQRVAEIGRYFFAGRVLAHGLTVEGICQVVEPSSNS
jgi:hypothetical protein